MSKFNLNLKIFENSILLITGGTGSFGHALVKRVIDMGFKEIRIFSRDEKKQDDMRIEFKKNNLSFYIGDVRDTESIRIAMKGVNYVFHAAALKQVPSCEFFPMEALNTNVIGTNNVMSIATEFGVKNVVILSTDKAVYPINAMGISKAMSEKIMIARSRSQIAGDTIFSAVRYGNVMGSRGSVLPLFVNQIKNGIPLTITDLSMTRFMMTLDNSIDLVLFALAHSNPGEIFIYKARSAKIAVIIEALSEIFNKKFEIKKIGIRHGEKLYESLISNEEFSFAKDMGEFVRVCCDGRDLNYDKYYEQGELNEIIGGMHSNHNESLMSLEEVKEVLLKLDFIKNEI
jgi:UDP-N-acetylglucosamine 4,6-dehydratase